MKKSHTQRSVMGGESTDVPVESVGSGRAARMFAGESACCRPRTRTSRIVVSFCRHFTPKAPLRCVCSSERVQVEPGVVFCSDLLLSATVERLSSLHMSGIHFRTSLKRLNRLKASSIHFALLFQEHKSLVFKSLK